MTFLDTFIYMNSVNFEGCRELIAEFSADIKWICI